MCRCSVTFSLISASRSASSSFRVMISRARAATICSPMCWAGTVVCWDFAASTAACGDRGGRTGAVFLQPGMEPGLAGTADPVRGPVFGQQQQGGLGTAVVKGPLQRGEVFEQLGLQAVDRPDPVRGFVRPAGGQDPQPGADLIPGPQRLQVPAHPGLVGDHGGVFGVCLAVAAVDLGGVVDGPARDVEDVLAVADEQGDQQRRSAMVQVRRPDHLVPVPELQHGGDEFEQGRFVVGDSWESRRFPSASITTQ